VVQSLAVFYGRNRHDYYVTEGLPLLLTTTLPFAVWGAWNAFFEKLPRKIDKTQKVTRPLTLSVVVFVAIMSLIAHKEVRFIYPLLPALVVLAANPFSRFFFFPSTNTKAKKTLLIVFMAINMTLAFYTTQIHQRGVIDVLHHLRHQAAAIKTNTATTTTRTNPLDITNTTIIFLMPCHSTPWKSHLIGSNIDARALTCEPPLTIPLQNRSSYTDEADEFYNDPVQWMQQHMQETSTIATLGGKNNHSNAQRGGHVDANQAAAAAAAWPEYLVFFGQLEETIKGYLAETLYRPCWRGFNTHWHDDWRRQGDVVVWCLKGDE
jgi:phosphatidylinositol glycan class B